MECIFHDDNRAVVYASARDETRDRQRLMPSSVKYRVPTGSSSQIMKALEREVFNFLPRNAVNVEVVVDEYLASPSDEIVFRRIYHIDQIQGNNISGKPYRMFYTREVGDQTETLEFGYIPLVEVHKLLNFLYYQATGLLTQVRTGFVVKDQIVEIPILVSETKELGMFLEIGNSVGPISHLQGLLKNFKQAIALEESWLEPRSYKELLAK
jgi:adenylate cyclase class IV